MNTLIAIVPNLPPQIDGVGDYASVLAGEMRATHGIDTKFFVVGNDAETSPPQNGAFPREGRVRLLAALASDELATSTVLLHYSGYGYARRGTPLWLVQALEKWRKTHSQSRLIVVFHELAADGSPLTSAFWLRPLQRSLIKRLVAVADHLVVTTTQNYHALLGLVPWVECTITIQPVFSTAGELSSYSSLQSRSNYGVVFGTPGRRHAVYGIESKRIQNTLTLLQVTKILDLGAGDSRIPNTWNGVSIEHHESPSAEELHTFLSQARCGFVEYPGTLLAKSTIFAAYAAHGVLPIVLRSSPLWCDELSPTQQLVYEQGEDRFDFAELEDRASRAKKWYETHTRAVQGALFAAMVEKVRKSPPRCRTKVLLLSSQPNQSSVAERYFEEDSEFNVFSAYCTGFDSALWRGEEYINKEVFDAGVVPFTRHCILHNVSPRPSLNRFFGLVNPRVLPLVYGAELCVIYGHAYCSLFCAAIVARILGKKVLLSNDAVDCGSRGWFLSRVKSAVFFLLYNYLVQGVLVPSTRAVRFMAEVGVSRERIFLTPYVVDNERIAAAATVASRESTRERYGVPLDKKVILFVAKFIERKRPQDLLRACALLAGKDFVVVMVGDGPLRKELQDLAKSLHSEKRFYFVGMVPYRMLPELYAAADIFVHPAAHEPFGLIVNEAMLCRVPVIVSEETGAGEDLVISGESGYLFKAGDIDHLARCIAELLDDEQKRRSFIAKAYSRIAQWSPKENAAALRAALEYLEQRGAPVCE